jgi:hypothetical protein
MLFSSFTVLTLHQDPGILCQPRCNMYVSGWFGCLGIVIKTDDFVSCCLPVHQGKIAPVFIVCFIPRESPRRTDRVICFSSCLRLGVLVS